MPLKILHTADVHLGAKFLGLGKKGHEQRSRLLQVFEDTVNLAIREKVDLFLVAGDLFDSNEVSKTLLAQVAYRFQDLSAVGIPVFISPGTHDPYGPDSVYRASELSSIEGVTIFDSEEMLGVPVPGLDCVVYGNANMKPFKNRYPLDSLRVGEGTRWNVGVMHASFEIPDLVDDTYVVTPEQVAACRLDYLALGHIHSYSDRSRGIVTAFYPGSPEMVRMQKGGAGNVLVVELGDEETWVRPFHTGRIKFEEVNIKAEEATTAALVALLEQRADPDKVLQLNVEGFRPPGYSRAEDVLEGLPEMFLSVRVNDRSWPAPAGIDPDAYPPGSPAAEYLGLLNARLDGASGSELEEIQEAMMAGLSLLLEEEG